MEDWKEYKLKDFVQVNPRESISKGNVAKKVPMEAVLPFTKKIAQFEEAEYKGGVKFRNDDTIMARITPSLENGKTAYVDILTEDEIGFGSTEFVVFRERKDVSDAQYIYYFAISPEFRDTAIKSMTGTSGRQRVQIGVVKEFKGLFPPLPEQKAIAWVLSRLDDKIDLLHRQNQTLEEMAETLFREWFVEQAEEDCERVSLKDIVDIVSSKRIFYKEYVKTGVPFYRSKEIIELREGKNVDDPLYISDERFNELKKETGVPKEGDIMLTSVGTLGVSYRVKSKDKFYFKDGNLVWFKNFNTIPDIIIYCWLNSMPGKNSLEKISIGSTQRALTLSGLRQIKIKVPPQIVIKKVETELRLLYNKIDFNLSQIQTLTQLRDTLLPKLMRGEVRVKQ